MSFPFSRNDPHPVTGTGSSKHHHQLMKKSKLLTTALLALFGAGLLALPAKAATSPSYTAGDMFLVFHATSGQGNTTDYVINIGQGSIYRDATSTFSLNGATVDIGNIATTLVDTYGSDWNTRSDLYWGVFGTTYTSTVGNDPVGTLYATKPETTIGTIRTSYFRSSETSQLVNAGSDLQSMANAFSSGNYTVTGLNGALETTTDNNSLSSFLDFSNGTPVAFTSFTGSLGTFGSGTAGTALDLFRMAPTDSVNLRGSYEGTFTISDSGVVTFAAVPEPSVCLLFAAGSAFVLVLARRRKSLNA